MRMTLTPILVAVCLFGCGDPGGTTDAGDATLSGMCPASAPTAGGTCSMNGLQCGPFPYGHVDCFRPGQMTTGYPIVGTFTCSGGTWSVQTMSQGSCPDF